MAKRTQAQAPKSKAQYAKKPKKASKSKAGAPPASAAGQKRDAYEAEDSDPDEMKHVDKYDVSRIANFIWAAHACMHA